MNTCQKLQLMPDCNFPTCTRHPESNGYCVFHQMYSNSVSVRMPKAISKESDKEKELKKNRKVRYKEFLKKNPLCKAKFSKQCKKIADSIHHLKGRTPAIVDDERYWLACCSVCNNEIEARHADAEKAGLKIPRHKKA